MLVLSRRAGESIRIFNDIKVMVLGVNGGVVRIGVEAPSHVPINREEIACDMMQNDLQIKTLADRNPKNEQ